MADQSSFHLIAFMILGRTCAFVLRSTGQYSFIDDSHPRFITIDDFNNDSWSDIVVVNSGSNNLGVFLGNDNATFGSQVTYSTGSGSIPYTVAVGDFNHDHRLDLAVANFGTNSIGILL
jgi:hypothetical protein